VESFVRNFIRMSLVWFSIGLLIGFSMVFWPSHIVYRPAHVHALLLGFLSMMIFGVSYHVLPRFTGRPLHSRSLARVHFWSANIGLVLLAGGFILRVHLPSVGSAFLSAGALTSTLGGGLYVYNAWRTLGPAPPQPGAPIQLKGSIQ
jgi:cytochrome c oxidase cbb3-type subunit 1